MKAKKANGPKVVQVCNTWTLWDHPTAKREWSMERKLAAVKEAGFDGFISELDAAKGRMAEELGLCTVGWFPVQKISELRRHVGLGVEGRASRMNVHIGTHDTSLDAALRLAIALVEEGERAGVPCDIEVHRNTATETPEKLDALAKAFKKSTGRLLPLTWDFSHLAVVKHLDPPYEKRLLGDVALIQHARQFHFRPFNGHHCQVPVTNGKGKLTPEFVQYGEFMKSVIALYLKADHAGREVYVCPEMGPYRGGYNLSLLPRAFDEACVLRGIIEEEFRAHAKTRRRPDSWGVTSDQ